MRGVARLAAAGAVLAAILVPGAPAAAAGVSASVDDITYVPQISASNGQVTQVFHITTDRAVKVSITSAVPGPMVLVGQSVSLLHACVSTSSAITCVLAADSAAQFIRVGFGDSGLDDAVATKASATFTSTMVVKPALGGATITTATGSVKVRPSADLWIGTIAVQGSAPSYGLQIALNNRGPSGSTTTTATVSGFQSQPTGPLPTGCTWTGLTVVCVHHAAVTVDDTRTITLPLVAAQRGCAYTIHISGPFPDPQPADNTSTFAAASAPCTTSSPTAGASVSPTVTATPTLTASPSAGPPTPSASPSSGPSGPPSGTAPVEAGGATGGPAASPAPAGGMSRPAMIAFGVAFAAILFGGILAIVALRRRPRDNGDDLTAVIRR